MTREIGQPSSDYISSDSSAVAAHQQLLLVFRVADGLDELGLGCRYAAQDAWIELNGEEEFVGDSLTCLDVSDRESDVRNFKKTRISDRHQPTGCPDRAVTLPGMAGSFLTKCY